MFEKKRRSRAPYIFLALFLTILLGSNGIGYFLAGKPVQSLTEPSNIPLKGALPFGLNFRVVLPTFAITVPYEIGGFHLINAYPEELTLRYEDQGSNDAMMVTISDSRFYFEQRRPIGFPESFLARKGMTGQLIHEVFARGPSADGISLNPYQAIREGLAARLRKAMSGAAAPASLHSVFVTGTNREGQVWRYYQDQNGIVPLVEGTIFKPNRIAHISIHFSGSVKDAIPILTFFSNAIEFIDGDPSLNESLADTCLSEELHEVETPWEAGCRQTYLVASLISQKGGIQIAKSLYGEYLTNRDEKGIRTLFDELHFEMHVVEGWQQLIDRMKKDNPDLAELEKSDS